MFVVNLALADLSVTGFINPFSIVGKFNMFSICRNRSILTLYVSH